MKKLENRVALITGASSGIGEAIARLFVQEGACVALAARSREKLEALARSLGGKTLVVPTDLAEPNQVREMVRATQAHFGRIDILINNAGVGMYASAAEMRPDWFEKLIATNWLGPVYATQAVIPGMREQGGGHIVNISSVAGKIAIPWMAAYCSSKFALNAFSNSLRMELERDRIRVLVVCPGRVRTPFTENAFKDRVARPLVPGGISSERVARATLRALLRGKREIVVPASNWAFVWLRTLWPALIDHAMLRVLRHRMRRD